MKLKKSFHNFVQKKSKINTHHEINNDIWSNSLSLRKKDAVTIII